VLAGTNGAGKSSILGEMLTRQGTEYYNPDTATKSILAANLNLSLDQANSAAWNEGRRMLERAIDEKKDFAFETTLGGNTIPNLLEKALSEGLEVRIWYVALHSPELHLARVRSRVSKGGHDIPEDKVRERYNQSILNLIHLLPRLTQLRLYDNSAEADPQSGLNPEPTLILHCKDGKIIESCELRKVPDWAKPVIAIAVRKSK
jgi:predicted ABC-type ATPase